MSQKCLSTWTEPTHRVTAQMWIIIEADAVQVHCNENPIYVFLFWEFRGINLNFHIHVSVSNLYILRIGPHIWLQQNDRPILEKFKSLTDI
jgi:hypothetical protein